MKTWGVIKTNVLFNLLTQSISTFVLIRQSTTSFTTMDKTIIFHSEKCENPSTYKLDLCHKCRNKYKNENRRLNNMKKNGQIIQPSTVPVNQRSLYSQVLCDECKYKSHKQFCADCKRNNRKAINAVYYKKKY